MKYNFIYLDLQRPDSAQSIPASSFIKLDIDKIAQ
jgi:hypothetical protein